MNWFVWSVVLTLLFFVPQTTRAQTAGYRFLVSDDSLTSNVPMNEISPQAFRHFERGYGRITATYWSKYAGGYLVRFYTADSTQYYVYLSRHGVLGKTVIYFTPSGVPHDVRAAMEQYDRGGSILFAGELIDGQETLYEIGLLDGSEVRIVDLRDGDIQAVCEYPR
jgi:hypothetical protein